LQWHLFYLNFAFKLAGIATMLTLPVVLFFLKESKEFLLKKETTGSNPVTLLLNDNYRSSTLALWLAIFMSFATLYFLTTWIPKLASATGLSDKLAIYAGTLFNLGAFFGIISRGYISRKWRLHATIIFYLVVTTLLMLLFGFFENSIIILLFIGAIGFGIQGGFVGMYSIAAIMYPAQIRATGVGWAVGIGRVGAIAGPFLGGILVSEGFGMAFSFMFFAVPTLISAVAVIFIRLQPK
jgi:MFS transporter, AAHS family, 4-hydroxybenzoate transporter